MVSLELEESKINKGRIRENIDFSETPLGDKTKILLSIQVYAINGWCTFLHQPFFYIVSIGEVKEAWLIILRDIFESLLSFGSMPESIR